MYLSYPCLFHCIRYVLVFQDKVDNDIVRQEVFDSVFELCLFVPLNQVSIDISRWTMTRLGKKALDNDFVRQEGFDSVFELCLFHCIKY